jgi:hypothetical protein
MMVSHAPCLTVLAVIPFIETGTRHESFFRSTENAGKGVAGNAIAIVHTAPAFNPTAHQAAPQ